MTKGYQISEKSGDSHRADQHVHGRAVRPRRGIYVGAGPGDPELVRVVPVVVPDRVRVLEDEVPDGLGGPRLLQVPQVPHEDALELGPVVAAVRLAPLEQHAVLGQVRDGGGGDIHRLVEERGVARGLGQLDEAAEDDALVVGPGLHPVVLAVVGEPVVDQVVSVDQPAVLEPIPLRIGDV